MTGARTAGKWSLNAVKASRPMWQVVTSVPILERLASVASNLIRKWCDTADYTEETFGRY